MAKHREITSEGALLRDAAGNAASLRVGLIGHGAIGRHVADALRSGVISGASLAGVLTRNRHDAQVGNSGRRSAAPRERVETIDELIERSDLIVEVAGHDALARYGPSVLDAGVDLVVVSTGALADAKTLEALHKASPGRLLVCPGAVGGIDLLRAVRLAGSPVSVSLRSVKKPASLAQSWMSLAETEVLSAMQPGDPEHLVFEGPARQAAILFPQNANIAATLALALGDWDAVTVQIVADASTSTTIHTVSIASACGNYRLELQNSVSLDNPATSSLVAPAVLRCIEQCTDNATPRFL